MRGHQAGRLGDDLTIPILLAAIPIAGVLLGWWLDRRVGTFPWLTIALLGMGFVGAARELWLRVKSDEAQRRSSKRG